MKLWREKKSESILIKKTKKIKEREKYILEHGGEEKEMDIDVFYI
jgi:hypothetical protein